MDNYTAQARTNYFRVKDDDLFSQAVRDWPNIKSEQRHDGKHMLYVDTTAHRGGWPSTYESQGSLQEFDPYRSLAPHLADHEVAIFFEVGHEGMSYLNGFAIAINNKLETRQMNLNEIFVRARDLTERPDQITQALD